MAILQAASFADIAIASLDDLGRGKMTDIISTYQNTIGFKRFARKKKMTFESGPNIQFNLIIDHNGSARAVGLYYQAQRNDVNVLTTGTVPWRHFTHNWVCDHRVLAMNRSASKIVDELRKRDIATRASLVIFMETRIWRATGSSTSEHFLGIPNWIVKSNTAVTTNEGFNGSTPSGHTTVAGITPSDASISPKWNNYARQYTTVNDADFVDKLELMSDMIDFQPIVDDIPQYGVGNDYGYYTTRAVRKSLKDLLKGNNDALGMDLDPVGDRLRYRRAPLVWVKELDLDTTGPLYAINWSTFHGVALKDWFGHKTKWPSLPDQPTTMACDYDYTWNTICQDRRKNGILATNTTMPA